METLSLQKESFGIGKPSNPHPPQRLQDSFIAVFAEVVGGGGEMLQRKSKNLYWAK